MRLCKATDLEHGRTMIEMISVLLLMGLISTAAMVWWSKAINTQKANAILEEIGKRASVVDVSNRPSSFVTNLYDDKHYTKMSYGFGVSAPEFVEDPMNNTLERVKIQVGAVKDKDGKKGNPVPAATCEILLERQGDVVQDAGDGTAYQTGNVVQRWEMQDKDGNLMEECSEQVVMIAWMNKTKKK
ncbi:MAG: type II secretion system protein [Alphaproteobacteria bacterium]|nr:type II secretion system protein [Alphaproteobacteria bacterium]